MNFSKVREFHEGWTSKLLGWIEKPSVSIVASITLYAPISFAILYYTTDSVKDATNRYLPESLKTWLSEHTLMICLSALLLAFIITHISAFLRRMSVAPEASIVALSTLGEGFEKIVAAKAQRFDFSLQAARKNGGLSDTAAFREITQPEQQLALLVHILHEFFHATTTNTDFKVRLLGIGNDQRVESVVHFAPVGCPPRTSLEVLRNLESSVSRCLKKKQIFVVADVYTQSRKPRGRMYVPSDADDTFERGSVLCFPVHHPPSNRIQYVVTVSSDKPYFKADRGSRKYYEWLLSQFALRINLEHTLILLKQTAV